jgi:putative radical SAM enzyme (TIGR03279 family)
MPFPQVVAVVPSSPAELAGLAPGDEIRTLNGVVPRDIIEYRLLADEAQLELEIIRGGLSFDLTIEKSAGLPLGIEVASALFDRVRTCDNHCEFCFIYQLPKKMRKSLYVKDDDYRLSFLYGNFTTLTRFTELDLERVVTERLSPLYVSIHATDPDIRARMLRNRRGATSLRWLRSLLDHGIEIHGQVVVCPGINDGWILADTLGGVLERFPDIASVGVVPLGVSKFSKEASMRSHTRDEARTVIGIVEEYQARFTETIGHPMVYLSDEYYLVGEQDFPKIHEYGEFVQHENGIGMSTLFEESFFGRSLNTQANRGGFFQSVDGAPALGYRAPTTCGDAVIQPVSLVKKPAVRGVTILTGDYGSRVLQPILERAGLTHVEILAIENRFFGGNISVAGLLTGADLSRELNGRDGTRRYLLPDVCLSEGRFLDGLTPADLPVGVEIIEATGQALSKALGYSDALNLVSLGSHD